MWAHRETFSLPRELETLPVVLPCKTKGLPAAWSIYTPDELTIVSDSGEFPSNTRLSRMSWVSKRSTEFLHEIQSNGKQVSFTLWQLVGISAALGWQPKPRAQHNSIITTAPSIAYTCGEGSENSPNCNGWRVSSSFPNPCIMVSERHW